MQCDHEHGFANEGKDACATELLKLKLKDPDTNNLDCERDLGKSCHLVINPLTTNSGSE